MKRNSVIVLLLCPLILLNAGWPEDGSLSLPYADAGLTPGQAAAHLLDRFAFGARPGEVDRVVGMGLENWLLQQLDQPADEKTLRDRLEPLAYLRMSPETIVRTYPQPSRVLRMAEREGRISAKDESLSQRERHQRLVQYGREKGYEPLNRLIGDMMANKLLRAVYSENQLTEVLVDFWFNHFNVSLTDNQARPLIAAYERDAIRPYVLGSFRDMLGATARHPAMLLYLDNAMSSAPDSAETLVGADRRMRPNRRPGFRRAGRGRMPETPPAPSARRPGQRRAGINENYARELLELHTLGVDGGYTQEDIIEVARAFTGWGVFPPDERGDRIRRRVRRARQAGFVIDGLFVFRADQHDAGEKRILGVTFPAGMGIDEGERVLDLLASHPSTATHIARKLAVRFVRDDPPQRLVQELAGVFLETGGNLRAMIIAIAESPEFWQQETLRAKIKSPFEVVTSALRALGADIRRPRPLFEVLRLMGQPLYAYQAPTGYPDWAEFWVNTGALLMRMNFGMYLATGKIPGLRFDLNSLSGSQPPATAREALAACWQVLLPERPVSDTLEKLAAALEKTDFADSFQDVFAAAQQRREQDSMMPMSPAQRKIRWLPGNPTLLARAAGLVIGSPEFQRR